MILSTASPLRPATFYYINESIKVSARRRCARSFNAASIVAAGRRDRLNKRRHRSERRDARNDVE